jgi:hypothetical protein
MLLREPFQNWKEHDRPRTSGDIPITFRQNLDYDPVIFGAPNSYEKLSVLSRTLSLLSIDLEAALESLGRCIGSNREYKNDSERRNSRRLGDRLEKCIILVNRCLAINSEKRNLSFR